MIIRKITKKEIPALYRLIKELAKFEKLSHVMKATQNNLAEELFGRNPTAEALVALVQERVVGYALYFHSFSSFLGKKGIYLEDVYVTPSHRGKGVGLKLLGAVAKIAVKRDCPRMEWAVLNWNTPAIKLYDSLGANRQKEWTTYRLTGKKLKSLASWKSRK